MRPPHDGSSLRGAIVLEMAFCLVHSSRKSIDCPKNLVLHIFCSGQVSRVFTSNS